MRRPHHRRDVLVLTYPARHGRFGVDVARITGQLEDAVLADLALPELLVDLFDLGVEVVPAFLEIALEDLAGCVKLFDASSQAFTLRLEL
jgi:hypothetical protein